MTVARAPRSCPSCRGRVLASTMTEAEERRFAAAYRCVACGLRTFVTWESADEEGRRGHRAIEEK